MIPLSIFSRYPSQGASSRYRFFMYISKLMANDFNIEVNSFFYSEYLEEVYGGKRPNRLKILLCYLARIFALLKSSKNLYIEYELFPKIPYFIESLFLKNKKYILNFDDDVWANYEKSKILSTKYDNLVKNANGIVVANDYLLEKVKKLNLNAIKIPTVVDLDDYKAEFEKFERFSIVWIGTPVTYKYILSHAEIFQEVAKKIDFDLLIIASKKLESKKIEGVNMRFFDWSPKIEVEILKRSHIGIMPLDDDGFAHGKSAFKLIQYLAAGIPSVATDLGENRNIIQDGESGFLVKSKEEWIRTISEIFNNQPIFDRISVATRQSVYEFSIQKYCDVFILFTKDKFD